MALDLSDLDSVRAFSKKLQQEVLHTGTDEERGLDYLINNAGLVGPPGQLTKQGSEITFTSE